VANERGVSGSKAFRLSLSLKFSLKGQDEAEKQKQRKGVLCAIPVSTANRGQPGARTALTIAAPCGPGTPSAYGLASTIAGIQDEEILGRDTICS